MPRGKLIEERINFTGWQLLDQLPIPHLMDELYLSSEGRSKFGNRRGAQAFSCSINAFRHSSR